MLWVFVMNTLIYIPLSFCTNFPTWASQAEQTSVTLRVTNKAAVKLWGLPLRSPEQGSGLFFLCFFSCFLNTGFWASWLGDWKHRESADPSGSAMFSMGRPCLHLQLVCVKNEFTWSCWPWWQFYSTFTTLHIFKKSAPKGIEAAFSLYEGLILETKGGHLMTALTLPGISGALS